MTFMCRYCNKPTSDKKNNAFYCNNCTKEMKRASYLWKAGDIWIWVKQGKVMRVVFKDKNLEPIYVRKEVIK